MREDEQVQVEVKLNQPAHAYLLWIDGKGVTTPLYPWNDLKIDVESVAVKPPVVQAKIGASPSALDRGWPVDDTVGLDTILLLARREPLPDGADLARLLGKLTAAPLRNRARLPYAAGTEAGRSMPSSTTSCVVRKKRCRRSTTSWRRWSGDWRGSSS